MMRIEAIAQQSLLRTLRSSLPITSFSGDCTMERPSTFFGILSLILLVAVAAYAAENAAWGTVKEYFNQGAAPAAKGAATQELAATYAFFNPDLQGAPCGLQLLDFDIIGNTTHCLEYCPHIGSLALHLRRLGVEEPDQVGQLAGRLIRVGFQQCLDYVADVTDPIVKSRASQYEP